MRNLGNERVIRIRIRQHRTDRQQHLVDGQGWTPLIPQDVEADGSVGVDVWVVDLGGEGDLGGFEGVVWNVKADMSRYIKGNYIRFLTYR